jgi:hypothetical protein
MKQKFLEAGIPKNRIADCIKRIKNKCPTVDQLIKQEKNGLEQFIKFEQEMQRWPTYIEQEYLMNLSSAFNPNVPPDTQGFLTFIKTLKGDHERISIHPLASDELIWAKEAIEKAETKQKEDYLLRAMKLNKKCKKFGKLPYVLGTLDDYLKNGGDMCAIIQESDEPCLSASDVLRMFERIWDILITEKVDNWVLLYIKGACSSEHLWKDLESDDPFYNMMDSVVTQVRDRLNEYGRVKMVLDAANYDMFTYYPTDRKLSVPDLETVAPKSKAEEDSIATRVHKKQRVAGRFSK